MANPTIKTIAKEAGVSVATVSKALNDMPDISDGMKRHIRDIALAQGYTANTNARQLASGHSHSVGLVVPDAAAPGCAQVGKGLFARLNAAGYSLYLNDSSGRSRSEALLTLEMLQKRVGALVIFLPGVKAQVVEQTVQGQIPVIYVGGPPLEGLAYSVSFDEAAGGRLAARHLLHQGHRQCRVFTPAHAGQAHNERVRGFVEYMRAHGADADARSAPKELDEEEGGAFLAARMLEHRRPHTGVFATCDEMALGALGTFRAAGCGVPQNLSVVGCGDIPAAKLRLASLTTLQLPYMEAGICAGDLAVQLMQRHAPGPRRVVLEATLVKRGSTASQ